MATSRKFYRNPFTILAKRKNYWWHGTMRRQSRPTSGLAPASRCHFIPVLTAGRQSRRLYVVPRTNRKTADWAFSTAAPRAWNQLPTELKKHNRHLPFAENWKRSFSTVHTAPNNTWYNHYVMRPRSYSRGLRNRNTYANANANRRHGQGIIIDWLIDWLIDRSIAFVHLSNN